MSKQFKNKKTLEVVDFVGMCEVDGELEFSFRSQTDEPRVWHSRRYNSIKELQEEWEDYEQKDYYSLDCLGGIDHIVILSNDSDKYRSKLKEIGNYFETKEEAEKAVEKLKAWKRLKDKGFKFCKYSALAYGEIDFRIPDFESWDDSDNEQVKHDLDLLFGGEE